MGRKRTFAERMTGKKTTTDKIPIACHKCGYFWHYGGEMSRATCPDCGAKVRVAENRQDTINDE